MVEFAIGDIINVNSNVDAGEGETISVYKWKWNNIKFGENTNNISIDTSEISVGNYNLSLEVQNSCGNWSIPYSETIKLVEEGEEPPEEDVSKMYGLLTGAAIGLYLMLKNK